MHSDQKILGDHIPFKGVTRQPVAAPNSMKSTRFKQSLIRLLQQCIDRLAIGFADQNAGLNQRICALNELIFMGQSIELPVSMNPGLFCIGELGGDPVQTVGEA